MPKRREDILARARDLTQHYSDRQMLPWMTRSADERLNVLLRIQAVERQLMAEFAVQRSTAVSQVAQLIRERTKKHVKTLRQKLRQA